MGGAVGWIACLGVISSAEGSVRMAKRDQILTIDPPNELAFHGRPDGLTPLLSRVAVLIPSWGCCLQVRLRRPCPR